jgi:Spy/CpxP family protein refolding chaperone
MIKDVLRLKLSPAQKTDIATLLKHYRDERGQELDALRLAMDGLAEVSYKKGAEEDAVREAYQAVAAAGEPVALSRGKLSSALKRLLTTEQADQLDALRADRLAARGSQGSYRPDGMSKWIDKNAR